MLKVENIARLLGTVVKFCAALSLDACGHNKRLAVKTSTLLMKTLIPPLVRNLVTRDSLLLRLLSRSTVWELIGSVLSPILVEIVSKQGLSAPKLLQEEIASLLEELTISDDVKKAVKAHLGSFASIGLVYSGDN